MKYRGAGFLSIACCTFHTFFLPATCTRQPYTWRREHKNLNGASQRCRRNSRSWLTKQGKCKTPDILYIKKPGVSTRIIGELADLLR